MLAALLGPAATLRRSGADEIALHIRQAAEDGQHQPPGAGGSIGPGLGERAELCVGIGDALDDGEQVEGGAGETVDAGDRDHVTGREVLEHALQLAAIDPGTAGLLAVELGAPLDAKLGDLGIECLPVGADASVADQAARRSSSGHIFCKR